jgi:hypothetical protein
MRTRIVLALMAALTAMGMALAAPAWAGFVRTEVYWNGPECIMAVTADPNFPSTTWTHSICSPIGAYVLTESNVWKGDWAGVDPIMGAATYIECQTWINGRLVFSDSADAGDGTDVNCLGVGY